MTIWWIATLAGPLLAAPAVWRIPLHYVSAADVADRLREVFGASTADLRSIAADAQRNELVIVGTERAYRCVLRLLRSD